MDKLTPIKAIRSKCLDCSGGQPLEVRLCTVEGCAIWPYRRGKRPKGNEGTDGEKNAS